MDYQVILVFIILALALYLFMKEIFSVDTTALLVMVLLIVTGLVSPEEGVSGFSNPATITVMSMFILSAGIQRTGIIQSLGDKLLRFTKKSEFKQMITITFLIGPISAFVNNTAAVAVMLPLVTKLARKTKVFASKLLIPLSFVSMAGGMLTILGTSTSILAATIYTQMGYGTIGIFDFTKLGAIVLGTTILYFVLVGRFLLPKRSNPIEDDDPHDQLTYHTEIIVQKDSKLIGQVVNESVLKTKFRIEFLNLKRGEKFVNPSEEKFRPGDILLINATREALLSAKHFGLVEMKAHVDFPEKRTSAYGMVQFMVSSVSTLIGHTLNSISFRDKYKAVVMGVQRGDEVLRKGLGKIKFKFGDILLLRATEKSISKLKQHKDFIFISDVPQPFNRKKTWYALSVFTLVVVLAALKIPIMVAALIGVILMVISKVITFKEGYQSVSWEVILLLAGFIPLGIAVEKSGAALLVSEMIVSIASNISPLLLIGLVYFITTLLTEVISNNAAVIVLLPIVLSLTNELSLNPLAFTLAVMFAASTSFLSPIGYQTNTMVYSAGNYKFKDFVKVGLPLNLILLVVTIYFIGRFWGL